jgi:hypothetical protein
MVEDIYSVVNGTRIPETHEVVGWDRVGKKAVCRRRPGVEPVWRPGVSQLWAEMVVEAV